MQRAIIATLLFLIAPLTVAEPELRLFFEAASADSKQANRALKQIAAEWSDGYAIMFVDIARLMPADRPARRSSAMAGSLEGSDGGTGGRLGVESGSMPFDPRGATGGDSAFGGGGSPIRRRLMRFLKKQTGQRFGDDLDRWRRWIWSQPYAPHADYALFKAALYRNIDPRMISFFPPKVEATIRLDEIDWGGVAVNGIPPLDRPRRAPAGDATWMSDSERIFGVEIDGEARAYPQRIIAWHELVRDRIGETPIALVYCTLCGSVIPYESRLDGEELTLGTSGLLYRSNKLMFDEQSKSLWSSLYGRAVVGSRVSSNRELKRLPVIATSWGEWKRMHPETTVLTEETGHQRDYREGVAYAEYTATDEIWFEVPIRDDRLKNKSEIVSLVVNGVPLAIARERLAKQRVLHHRLAGIEIVLLTDSAGGTRAYRTEGRKMERWLDADRVADAGGSSWKVTEGALLSEEGEQRLLRIPSSPSYWFGWVAQYPETELID